MNSDKLEINHEGRWVAVEENIFRAWTGERRKNGSPFHGPVYEFTHGRKAKKLWKGPRLCRCAECQSTVEPRFRPN